MKVYNCTTCDTELKPWEAHLRGNVIDDEPTAWCRIHAVAAGIFTPPMPLIPTPRVETTPTRARGLARLFA